MALKFLEKFSGNERRIFYITSLFVLLALFDRFFLGPVNTKLIELDDQVKGQKAAIMQDLQVLAYKDKINAEHDALKKYFETDVKDDNVVNAEFLSKIESIAFQSNVTLLKSTPTQTNKTDQYAKYYAAVDCSGSLENVITFMHNINTQTELLKIVDFSMAPRRGTADSVNASMQVVKLVMLP